MRQIYEQCASCFAWLGEHRQDIPGSDAKAALDLIEYMAETMEVPNSGDVPLPPVMQSVDAFTGPMAALRSISPAEHPWWHRIWTVQEAALPRKLHLVFGELLLPWDRLVLASRAWTTKVPPALWPLLTAVHRETLSSLMAHTVWVNLSKLRYDRFPLNLMVRWRVRKATEPLDKVYALLGLLPPGALPTVDNCDYGIDAAELYASTTIDLILRERDLRPLIADPRVEEQTPAIPKWALDMKCIPHSCEIYFPLNGYYAYNAANEQPLDTESLSSGTKEVKTVLPLKGSAVDRVQHVVGPQFEPNSQVSDQELVRVLRVWAKEAGIEFKGDGEIGQAPGADFQHKLDLRVEAFGRALIGDLVRDHEDRALRRAEVSDVQGIFSFLTGGERLPGPVRQTLWRMVRDSVFFLTKDQNMGVGHKDTVAGDQVWILPGARMPFTLRPRSQDDGLHFDFIGRCYMHGVMSGELFRDREKAPVVRDLRLH
jgi:hypothetical protein